MTKKEIMEALDAKGIKYDQMDTKGELENLLESGKSASAIQAEKDDSLDVNAKNHAEKSNKPVKSGKIDPKVGDLEVARSIPGLPSLKVEVVDKKRLKELESAGLLVGYKQSTKEASYRA